MATYAELFALRNDAVLLQRLSVAILVACETVRNEQASVEFHKNRVAWAQQAIQDPDDYATKALGLLLAANKSLTVAQINAATDAAIQSAIDALVNTLTGIN